MIMATFHHNTAIILDLILLTLKAPFCAAIEFKTIDLMHEARLVPLKG